MHRILIVDDDITFALMLKTWLAKHGFEVETASSVAAGRKLIEEKRFSLLLTDMRMPDQDGIYLLQWLGERNEPIPAIVMTSYADISNAVISMKLGASDYIAKPVNTDELLKKINETIELTQKTRSRKESDTKAERANAERSAAEAYIEGHCDAASRLYEHVRLVAPTNMSVLISGESGTGKEHIARLIHDRSRRSGKPFVAMDCGTIPRELAASEFFGHVKGSFTGAVSDKVGAFEAADGGTLFLDEVGNLNYETQVQLLRALQERRIRRVGGSREIPIDIRLVVATNENLESAIGRGTFRADLYHRINEFSLRVPPLRDQREDIMLYADFFLDQANRELGKQVTGFDRTVAAALTAYDWPGNLRQLKNTVMCATLLATDEYITLHELPAEIRDNGNGAGNTLLRNPDEEETRIRRALAAANGNKSMAAKMLGIDRKTLYNKLHAYGIE
ncbi:MAG TPA: sigma-54 dependent transcriptional regulator [Candidatus Alistipes excrementipullorum]|nr:sigma-54 dependent transcriptional regulator [Candidatus Alistipes excrementipullorum]